jgi:hypothetical protein
MGIHVFNYIYITQVFIDWFINKKLKTCIKIKFYLLIKHWIFKEIISLHMYLIICMTKTKISNLILLHAL